MVCVCEPECVRLWLFDFVYVWDKNPQQNPWDQPGFKELLTPMNWTPCLYPILHSPPPLHLSVALSSLRLLQLPILIFFFTKKLSTPALLSLHHLLSFHHLPVLLYSLNLSHLLFLTFFSFLPSLLISSHPSSHFLWSLRIVSSFGVFSFDVHRAHCGIVHVYVCAFTRQSVHVCLPLSLP